ncbi:DUF11 domain-containing protein [Paenibacillus methanolicus]|uniref:Putative repeat protein (TIGR01451 family) n=1 Tax=Paenibacillus methanolicus TaxID=582686 RepID=A0A5S5C374_9BACL|nr:DUF11 domain-containing protein [Paenibacillus methanolicus]TYP72423.1 putative repeat protein (TIGR01451 family) [Paenibacillus methanolicus]
MTPDGPRDFTVQNQTHVRFQNGTYEGVAYSNTVSTPLVGPLLKAAKSVSTPRASINQVVTFSIALSNSGNRSAQVTVIDPLPAGLSFIANSVLIGGVPLTGISPSAGIPVGIVNVGATILITFQAIVVSMPPGLRFANQARVEYVFTALDGRSVSGTLHSNTASFGVNPFRLSASASSSTTVTFAGDVIPYELAITNEGSEPLENVVITIPLPEGFEFVPGSVVINGVLMPGIDPNMGIPIGTLLPGQSVRVSVHLRVTGAPASEQVVIQGRIAYTIGGAAASLLANPLVFTVVKPQVSIQLQVDRTQASVNDTLQYVAVVRNDSSFAVDVRLFDLVPPGTSFVTDSLTLGGQQQSVTRIEGGLPLGTLLANSQLVVACRVKILSSAVAPGLPPILEGVRASFTFRLADGRVVSMTAASNAVKTGLFAPLIAVTAAAQPQYVEPGESVGIGAIVRNNGNLSADVTLYRTAYPPEYYIRDVRIAGRIVPGFPLTEGLYLGTIPPGGSIRVAYIGDIGEDYDVALPDIVGLFTARYKYRFDEQMNSGESRSNEYVIVVDQTNE